MGWNNNPRTFPLSSGSLESAIYTEDEEFEEEQGIRDIKVIDPLFPLKLLLLLISRWVSKQRTATNAIMIASANFCRAIPHPPLALTRIHCMSGNGMKRTESDVHVNHIPEFMELYYWSYLSSRPHINRLEFNCEKGDSEGISVISLIQIVIGWCCDVLYVFFYFSLSPPPRLWGSWHEINAVKWPGKGGERKPDDDTFLQLLLLLLLLHGYLTIRLQFHSCSLAVVAINDEKRGRLLL